MWDKESSLGGWGRIVASVTQIGAAVAILANRPDAVPDLTDAAGQGQAIIDQGYALIEAITLFISGGITAWSKFFTFLKR